MGAFLIMCVLVGTLWVPDTRVSADPEVFPDYQRRSRDEASSVKWPDPDLQPEDALVDQVSSSLNAMDDGLMAERMREQAQREQAQRELVQREQTQKEQAQKEQAQKEQAQREQAQKEQAQREQAQKLQAQRVQAQREQAQREQAQREQAQREQAQREQAQREQAQREQAQRDPAQREQAQEGVVHQEYPMTMDKWLREMQEKKDLFRLGRTPSVMSFDSSFPFGQPALQEDVDEIEEELRAERARMLSEQQQQQYHEQQTERARARSQQQLRQHDNQLKALYLQQQRQDRHQQMLLDAQVEQLAQLQKEVAQAETLAKIKPLSVRDSELGSQEVPIRTHSFEFSFPKENVKNDRAEFAVSPSDPRYYQPDPRLDMFSRQSTQPQVNRGVEDDLYMDESATNSVRNAILRSAGIGAGISSELRDSQDDDFAGLDEDLVLTRQTGGPRMRFITPAVPDSPREVVPADVLSAKVLRGSTTTELGDIGSKVTTQEGLVKKQLTFPKDHWFLGMDDIWKLTLVIGLSVVISSLMIAMVVCQCRLARNNKAAAEVDYPAYGVTGPNKEVSPTGDRRLAQSAQMYHYQHQKQQILAMEKAGSGRRGSMSEAESEDENEEGDYTVYECPGLAPTGEMEVKNPLFQDDPTPATPGAGAPQQTKGDSTHGEAKP